MQEQILLAGSTEKSRMLLQTLLPPGTNPPPRMLCAIGRRAYFDGLFAAGLTPALRGWCRCASS